MTIRKTVQDDIPVLGALIDASVRGLQAGDYTPEQIDRALIAAFGVDRQLIADGTYFVVELEQRIVACADGAGAKRYSEATVAPAGKIRC